MIYLRHGAVVHETIILAACPGLDIPRVTDCVIAYTTKPPTDYRA